MPLPCRPTNVSDLQGVRKESVCFATMEQQWLLKCPAVWENSESRQRGHGVAAGALSASAVLSSCFGMRCPRRARVKFWFIKNYMSPQMKRFLPAMAQRYGFEYSTVTYKWPSWLHKQARATDVTLSYCSQFFLGCGASSWCVMESMRMLPLEGVQSPAKELHVSAAASNGRDVGEAQIVPPAKHACLVSWARYPQRGARV